MFSYALGTFLMLIASASEVPEYTVRRVDALPGVEAAWDAPAWARADTLRITKFHERSSAHHPKTEVRMLHDGDVIAVMFRVEDEHVLARYTEYQSPTHRDSCVEFFAKPSGALGYFNFEFNAVGTLLLWYVEDPRRVDGAFAKYTKVSAAWAERIAVHTSLAEPIPDEQHGPQTWTVSFRVPVDLFRECAGEEVSFTGQTWTGNVYKCADDSAYPHWGAWADIGDRLDFHQPARFGRIVFEK